MHTLKLPHTHTNIYIHVHSNTNACSYYFSTADMTNPNAQIVANAVVIAMIRKEIL